MPTKANRAIGSLDFSDAERKKLALKSRTWRCETCGLIKDLLVHPDNVVRPHSNLSPTNIEPSTSHRIPNDAADSESDRQSQSSSSRSNYSDGGSRDSSPDLKERKSSSNPDSNHSTTTTTSANSNPLVTAKTNLEQILVRPLNSDDGQAGMQSSRLNSANNQSNESNRLQQHLEESNSGIQSLADRRRVYPPLVLKSIFILLSLLILRRVVMVIQS